jgi:hypothetical protein
MFRSKVSMQEHRTKALEAGANHRRVDPLLNAPKSSGQVSLYADHVDEFGCDFFRMIC